MLFDDDVKTKYTFVDFLTDSGVFNDVPGYVPPNNCYYLWKNYSKGYIEYCIKYGIKPEECPPKPPVIIEYQGAYGEHIKQYGLKT